MDKLVDREYMKIDSLTEKFFMKFLTSSYDILIDIIYFRDLKYVINMSCVLGYVCPQKNGRERIQLTWSTQRLFLFLVLARFNLVVLRPVSKNLPLLTIPSFFLSTKNRRKSIVWQIQQTSFES